MKVDSPELLGKRIRINRGNQSTKMDNNSTGNTLFVVWFIHAFIFTVAICATIGYHIANMSRQERQRYPFCAYHDNAMKYNKLKSDNTQRKTPSVCGIDGEFELTETNTPSWATDSNPAGGRPMPDI